METLSTLLNAEGIPSKFPTGGFGDRSTAVEVKRSETGTPCSWCVGGGERVFQRDYNDKTMSSLRPFHGPNGDF
jgi:hypothetical protein